MKLHLLDGTYELFRSYFGVPSRTAPDGMEVAAVYGIIGSTLGLLRQLDVTHVAAAFDTVIESFRNDMFPGYKTGEGIEPELLAQFPLAERALNALGVVVWSMIEFEADDAIASAAFQFGDDFDQVVMLSPDKDLSQCVVDNRIVTFDRRQEILRGEDEVMEKFGVWPQSIPDYLALVGDTADGIPGLPGWGAKSSSAVLARFTHIEDIPAAEAEWGVAVRSAGKLAATLEAHRDEALLYRSLAVLRRDVPIEESVADLEWKGAHRQEFEVLCAELGFDDLASRPHLWADESTA
ncbi:MAG: 5'-3' exonuclease [Acidimicrobiia bacterium]|nr:5'-3' exonuclease [Acidimicrobiia bacterium]NNC42655.1 5'-3' exonuclease [Acidimicrobiia bacterium]NND14187.1 5'-3' exonuclease [Acidimicrobiia bacterium]NNL28880.1 5'-3' exonuclease [Acidimicrobiia bacterium]